jgi:TolB-like protein/DNA-binding winged helix-turn-helix (wHTH) protein
MRTDLSMDGTLSSGGSPPLRFRFDVFELDVRTGELLKGTERLNLPEKPRQLLAALLERPGEVITREELRSRLWSSDIFVDFDDNLNHAVRKVRETLGDTADRPTFIETLPRHGYRFIASVERIDAPVHSSGEGEQQSMAAGRFHGWTRWAAAGLVTLLAAGAYLNWRISHVSSDTPARVMLAVLPLENLSAKPDEEFLSASLTEKIITELGRVNPSRLGVIARTSSMAFRGTNKSVAEIGNTLRVDYVLEGATLLVGRRLRVSLQLIRVDDQTHLISGGDGAIR